MSDRTKPLRDKVIAPERMQILKLSRDQVSKLLSQRAPECMEHSIELIKTRSYTDLAIHHQQHYADALHYLSTNASRLSAQFEEQYSESFAALFASNSQADRSAESLSLVQDSELERQIRLDTATARVVNENRKELHQLLLRINYLSEREFSTNENPLGPRFITSCFEKLIAVNISQNRVQMLVLKAFEEKILLGLKDIYPEVNLNLAERGVLPDLDMRVRKNPASQRPVDRNRTGVQVNRNSDGAGRVGNGRTYGDAELGGSAKQRFKVIYERVQKRRDFDRPDGRALEQGYVAEEPGHYRTEKDHNYCDRAQLLELLSGELQSSGETEDSKRLLEDNSAHERRIAPKLAELAAQKQLKPIHKNDLEIANLIDELFEHAREWDGAGVCERLFETVDQLRVPIAKIALGDSEFLEKPHHPVRRFFSEVSELAWVSQTQDQAYHQRINTKLESIVTGFENIDPQDRRLQSEHLGSMLATLDVENRQVRKRERLLINSETGRNEIQHATNYVARYIQSKQQSVTLPEYSQDFLTEIWSKLLLRAFLIRHKQQDLWITVTELTQQFMEIYSTADFADSESTEADQLLVSVRNILSEHGLNDHVSDRLLSQVAAGLGYDGLFYTGSKANSALLETTSAVAFGAPALGSLSVNMAANEEIKESDDFDLPESHHSWQAELPIGSWVALSSSNGEVLSCRLLTVINPGESCLFVDGLGRQVASMHSSKVREALDGGMLIKQDHRNAFELAE